MVRAIAGVLLLCITGCNCGGGGGGAGASGALILGVEPVPGQLQLTAWLGAVGDDGRFVVPDSVDIEVTCSEGGPCAAIDDGRTHPGSSEGVLAIILDDSGSNSAGPLTCTGCPTDPDERRFVATRELVRRVLGRAPSWRIALFDFPGFPNGGRIAAIQRAGYTSFVDDFEAPLATLGAGGSTLLYDALLDVIPATAGERSAFDRVVPARVLVVSDGEDTSSQGTLEQVLAMALDAGVIVDAVGYGQRGDAGTVVLAKKAYFDLRTLAQRTGGFCTVVSADELPALFSRVGELYVAGYAERRFTIAADGGVVAGEVGLAGQMPESFRFEDER